jgi:hypothetical protein
MPAVNIPLYFVAFIMLTILFTTTYPGLRSGIESAISPGKVIRNAARRQTDLLRR